MHHREANIRVIRMNIGRMSTRWNVVHKVNPMGNSRAFSGPQRWEETTKEDRIVISEDINQRATGTPKSHSATSGARITIAQQEKEGSF